MIYDLLGQPVQIDIPEVIYEGGDCLLWMPAAMVLASWLIQGESLLGQEDAVKVFTSVEGELWRLQAVVMIFKVHFLPIGGRQEIGDHYAIVHKAEGEPIHIRLLPL